MRGTKYSDLSGPTVHSLYCDIISLSHAMRPGLQSAIFGGKIIELAKFCFMNKRFEPNLSFFSKPVIVSHCV